MSNYDPDFSTFCLQEAEGAGVAEKKAFQTIVRRVAFAQDMEKGEGS